MFYAQTYAGVYVIFVVPRLCFESKRLTYSLFFRLLLLFGIRCKCRRMRNELALMGGNTRLVASIVHQWHRRISWPCITLQFGHEPGDEEALGPIVAYVILGLYWNDRQRCPWSRFPDIQRFLQHSHSRNGSSRGAKCRLEEQKISRAGDVSAWCSNRSGFTLK